VFRLQAIHLKGETTMKWFRDRGGEFSALEAELRGRRPRPGAELEREIAGRVGGSPARRGGRPVLALLLTTSAAAAFLSFGGVGYAVDAVNTAVGGGSTNTASEDQYSGPCVEYVNPHGKVIPPAGLTPPGTNPKGGENPDGFYQVGNTGGGDVYVIDLGSGTVFGPYPGGTAIKYTQAPGKTPEEKTIGSDTGQAGAVYTHITGTGDFQIVPVGTGPTQTCLVPPPPK
jgi:hypothetical protein